MKRGELSMQQILIDNYNYPLADERIAKYPLPERDASKLLVWRNGRIAESTFKHVGEFLPKGSLLVRNNTRVIQARLVFHKSPSSDGQQGARIEVFCLEPIEPHDYQLSLSSTAGCVWKCMIGNLKKWKNGVLELAVAPSVVLRAERLATQGNTHTVRFSWDDSTVSFAEILDSIGELPIPPYLNRKTEESDKTTYQTVYSRIKGSVAAPTAGLHFTPAVIADLAERGLRTAELTLHVGAGTFQPVKTDDANQHTMHTEIVAVPKETIRQVRDNLGHIVAVGTTSVRTLESLYYFGEGVHNSECSEKDKPAVSHDLDVLRVEQFEPYNGEHSLTTEDALDTLLKWLDRTGQDTLHGETQIMIEPGFKFRIVNQMITNFHQPRSTLLLLVSAFLGDGVTTAPFEACDTDNGGIHCNAEATGDIIPAWHKIYHYALDHDFRFLSYGDSSLLFR